MSHAGPRGGGAGGDAAVPEAGVGKRGGGQALVVRVEGKNSPKKQKHVREAELMKEEVGAPEPFNNVCFNCKGSGHWKSECPFISTPRKRAVQTLVAARATCAAQGGHVARFASVCGGCGNAIVKGEDIVAPMPGKGDTVWHHRKCVANHLAISQAHAEEERTHKLTPEVETVLEWAGAVEPAHARVQAGPGTGKTQLIVRIYDEFNGPITPIVLAFNKDAVAVLKLRGVMNACTFHSHGYRLWRTQHKKAKLSTAKVCNIMRQLYPPAALQPAKHKYRLDVMGLIRHVKKLVSLAKAYALNPECHNFDEELIKVAAKHKISANLQATLQREQSVAQQYKQVLSMTREVLQESIAVAGEVFDYDDMIYMPVLRDLVKPSEGLVIVDECQDMDLGRATMVQRLTGSGRLLLVGDVNQALYGYTGAGADVLEHLEREMGINTTFALTCSWRLPKLHVQHAVEFMRKHGRDGFQLAEQSEALPGLIAYNSNFTRYRPSATGDHAVLCRTNKELMRIRMELAKRNIPCHMAGRQDLAKGLFKLLKQLASVSPDEAAAPSECTQWDFLVVALKRVISGESEDACLESGEGSEDEEGGQGGQGQDASGQHKDASELSAAAARRCRIDYAEVMLGMMAEMEATASEPNSRSLKRLRENIAKFREGCDVPQQDDDAPGAHVVRLMTIHKAKGMEFHRVYLLQPDNMPLKTVMMYADERDRACEINTAFVARTRSYADLIYLRHLHPTWHVNSEGQSWENWDFSQLWPSESEDTTSEERTAAHEDAAEASRKSLECTAEIAGFFGVMGLQVPGGDEMSELCSSVQSRAVLRDAVKRAYKTKAREVHPDKVLARTTARHRLMFSSGDTGADEARLKALFQELNEANDALKRWLEES